MSGAPIYKIVSKIELRPKVDSMNHAVRLIAFENLLKVISLNPSERSEVRGIEKHILSGSPRAISSIVGGVGPLP